MITRNLVTNETWESFWLNEGWTKMLERKIMMRIPLALEPEKHMFVCFPGGYNACACGIVLNFSQHVV